MKNKNSRGFTMVELLAVITIMGVLTVIAVPAVSKYINRSRNTSTETMLKSTYEAAENYIMENNIIVDASGLTIDVSDLVDYHYLEYLKDPIGNEANCGGAGSTVVVSKDETTSGGLVNYKYFVTLKCPQSGTLMYTFPRDDMLSNMLDGTAKYIKANNWYETIANGATKTITYSTLKSGGYIKDIKDYSGNNCNSSNSKVIVSYVNKNYKYQVNLQCGSKTYTGVYAYK